MHDDIAAPDRSIRLQHYIGANAHTMHTVDGHETKRCGLASTYQDKDDFVAGLHWFPGARWLASHPKVDVIFDRYVKPIQTALRRLNKDIVFRVRAEDNLLGFQSPTFVKSCALTNDNSERYLLPLNHVRHFRHVPNVPKNDIPFEDKRDTLLWRGATTGLFDRPGRVLIYRRFAEWRDAGFDVGYSNVVQLQKITERTGLTEADLNPCVKPRLSLKDMLAYKYLLCLEGNDVSSALKWMLVSQSVVLMPKPLAGSWYCEDYLQPYVHYVPVAADLSDLEAQVTWCRQNQGACRAISANAMAFMSPFLNAAEEDQLFLDVVSAYTKSVDIVVTASDRARFFPAG